MTLKSDSASTQAAPPTARPSPVTQAKGLTAAVAAAAAKAQKAIRTIHSLVSRARSQAPRKAPLIAPIPKPPSRSP